MVTPPFAAVCNRHGTPHLHRHPIRSHPDHAPSIPLRATLTLDETLALLDRFCSPLGRGPDLHELEVMFS